MQEGVIKYHLNHVNKPVSETASLFSLNAWRTLMHRLTLIGQQPDRYQGLGFGNISLRIMQTPNYIISGTQTGLTETLTAEDYCLIRHADPHLNTITSEGLCQPSSEALTHATVYQQNLGITGIIHVHSPEIWRQTETLGLPYTAADITYGTPEMALAVAQLFKAAKFKQHALFSMLGHEDGIISFGSSIEQAGQLIIHFLALALSIESQ